MPRLLLVDDNQRIHQIVETLLTATDIELTCASSGAEALDLLGTGAAFDVALLDTTMQGMDGWELLDRLRKYGATAAMPIAMMAGVLDVVDPETVRKAPIQGFLKKPVELRDLADRVRTLLATPVEPPPPEPAPEATTGTFETLPYLKLSDHPLPEADLLLLEPSDLFVEDAPSPEAPMESLELEELDLESLKGLGAPPEAPAAPEPVILDAGEVPELAPEDAYASGILELGVITDELPDLGPTAEQAEPAPLPEPVPSPAPELPSDWADESESLLAFAHKPARTGDDLAAAAMEAHSDFDPDSFLDADPGPSPTPAFLPEVPEYVTPERLTQVSEVSEADVLGDIGDVPDLEDLAVLDDAPPAADKATVPPWATTVSLLDRVEPTEVEPEPVPAPEAIQEALSEAVPEAVAEAVPQAVPVPAAPEPLAAGAADPLAALLADPVLMDRLTKAVVARLGDQALREIAWEVMPELADRLHRG